MPIRNYLTEVSIPNSWFVFQAGWKITPKPGLNLLVGDQGTGKSTLLKLLAKGDNGVSATLANSNPIQSVFFDSESHNPRIQSDLDGRMPTHTVLSSKFQSHGESSLPIILQLIEETQSNGLILLLDEPESGLSLRSQYKLASKLAALTTQAFVSTHSLVLMEAAHEVFSLEHNAWMHPTDFIMSQKSDRPARSKKLR